MTEPNQHQRLIESTLAICIGDTPLQQRCRDLVEALESTQEQLEAALAEAELKRIETHHANAKRASIEEQLEASRKDASRLRGLIDAGLGREQALQEQLEKLKKDYDDLRDHRVVLVNSSTTQNDESRPEGRPS